MKKDSSMGASQNCFIMNTDMKDFYRLYCSHVFFQCSFHALIISWPSRFSGRLPYSDVPEKGFIISLFAFSRLLLKNLFLPSLRCNLLGILFYYTTYHIISYSFSILLASIQSLFTSSLSSSLFNMKHCKGLFAFLLFIKIFVMLSRHGCTFAA